MSSAFSGGLLQFPSLVQPRVVPLETNLGGGSTTCSTFSCDARVENAECNTSVQRVVHVLVLPKELRERCIDIRHVYKHVCG